MSKIFIGNIKDYINTKTAILCSTKEQSDIITNLICDNNIVAYNHKTEDGTYFLFSKLQDIYIDCNDIGFFITSFYDVFHAADLIKQEKDNTTMKYYKLIKEYPNSQKLNTVLNVCEIIENNPEFWQECDKDGNLYVNHSCSSWWRFKKDAIEYIKFPKVEYETPKEIKPLQHKIDIKFNVYVNDTDCVTFPNEDLAREYCRILNNKRKC